MSLIERIKNKVLVRKSNTCENCEDDFACEIGITGCWCSQVKVSDETREYLRQNYKSCLCRECLEKFGKFGKFRKLRKEEKVLSSQTS